MSEPELRLVLPARAENVVVVRQALAGLGEALGLSADRVGDLKTVASEACNNVILHAYDGSLGPLEVQAAPADHALEITVSDRGRGFKPSASPGVEASLGLGISLIAALSDRFEIRSGSDVGTEIKARFSYATRESAHTDPTKPSVEQRAGTEMAMTAGAAVRPVLARVIGALAARADFSLDRLADTVLLGDAVSYHAADDFPEGRVSLSIQDGEGTLEVRVGPLVEGGGERIMQAMDLPGEGASLRTLAREMRIEREMTRGAAAEYLLIEVVG
jgi:serine/threonine-protein kinase RsbW